MAMNVAHQNVVEHLYHLLVGSVALDETAVRIATAICATQTSTQRWIVVENNDAIRIRSAY